MQSVAFGIFKYSITFVFGNTLKVFLNTPKVILNTPKVILNKAGLLSNKARLFQNKAGLLSNRHFWYQFTRFLDYKDQKYLQNPIKSINYLCVLLVVFVVFRQKLEFTATLLPPKMCLNTGVIED